MNRRRLGNTDLNLSEVGFGAWAIGGGGYAFGWGNQNDADSIAAIHRALDLGVNWIDTAAVYGLGHSEEVVGRALAGKRSEVVIATKCSLVWDDKGEIGNSLSAESILRECEVSLKRLRTDRIDLYQIHWPADEARIEEGWKAVNRLIADGKVRYGGVSNFNPAQMARAQKLHPIASLQPPYSMIRRAVESDTFSYCRQNHIGVVVYSPMQAGLLTGRFDIHRVAPDDWRRKSSEFLEPNLSVNLWFVDQLRPIAAKYGKTLSQLAIAWTLRLPVVTCAIVGARRPSQIEETVGGSGWKIGDEDLKAINELLAKRAQKVREVGGVAK